MSTCSKCRRLLPVEAFSPDSRAKNGRQASCKPCRAEASAKWHSANRERSREKSLRWSRANAEANRERVAEWAKANPERSRAQSAKWRKANPEKRAAMKTRWRLANPEKHREHVRAAHRRNPHLQAASRARLRNAPVRDLTTAQWGAILVEHNYTCAYCGISGVAMTQDHIIPLSRGGSHTASNVTPACRPCNSSKGTKTLEEWTCPSKS